jgi:hypothetical protein
MNDSNEDEIKSLYSKIRKQIIKKDEVINILTKRTTKDFAIIRKKIIDRTTKIKSIFQEMENNIDKNLNIGEIQDKTVEYFSTESSTNKKALDLDKKCKNPKNANFDNGNSYLTSVIRKVNKIEDKIFEINKVLLEDIKQNKVGKSDGDKTPESN